MPNLQYSAEAIGVLKKFHRCDAIVYVEGEDDELFWRTIFDKCAGLKVVPQPMGGCVALDDQIDRIIKEDLPVIAARDADFLGFAGQMRSDPRIVYTWGYSIENTLYTASAVSAIAHAWSRGRNGDLLQECGAWFSQLKHHLERLITYDIANFCHDLGCAVLGASFARYSTSEKSKDIAPEKVQRRENEVGKLVTKKMIDNLKLGSDSFAWVRGHFLQTAVMQFIAAEARAAGNKNKPSYAAVYNEAIMYLNHNLTNKHPHFRHYRSRITKAIKTMNA